MFGPDMDGYHEPEHSTFWYIGILAVVFCAALFIFASSSAPCEKPTGFSDSVTAFVSDTKAAAGCMVKSIVNSADYDKDCPVAQKCSKVKPSVTVDAHPSYASGGPLRGSHEMNLHDMVAHTASTHAGGKWQQSFGAGVHQTMHANTLNGLYQPTSCTTCHHDTPASNKFENMGSQVIGPQTVFSTGDDYEQKTGSSNKDMHLSTFERMQESVKKYGVISPLG
jgi:hypothetical protein